MVLISAGYSVHSAKSESVATGFNAAGFDLAVLCQSLESSRGLKIASILRSGNPAMQILRVLPEARLQSRDTTTPSRALPSLKTSWDVSVYSASLRVWRSEPLGSENLDVQIRS